MIVALVRVVVGDGRSQRSACDGESNLSRCWLPRCKVMSGHTEGRAWVVALFSSVIPPIFSEQPWPGSIRLWPCPRYVRSAFAPVSLLRRTVRSNLGPETVPLLNIESAISFSQSVFWGIEGTGIVLRVPNRERPAFARYPATGVVGMESHPLWS